jgi:hypothetical protein
MLMDQYTSSNKAHAAPAKVASPPWGSTFAGQVETPEGQMLVQGTAPRAGDSSSQGPNWCLVTMKFEADVRVTNQTLYKRNVLSPNLLFSVETAEPDGDTLVLPPTQNLPTQNFPPPSRLWKILPLFGWSYVQRCCDLLQQSFQPSSQKQTKKQPRL